MRLPSFIRRNVHSPRVQAEARGRAAVPAGAPATVKVETSTSAAWASAAEAPDSRGGKIDTFSPSPSASQTEDAQSAPAAELHSATDFASSIEEIQSGAAESEWQNRPESVDPLEASASDAEDDLTAQLRQAREEREAGRVNEARAILESAALRFPEAAPVRHDLARLAEAGRDWVAAERWWRSFAALRPAEGWVIPPLAHAIRLQGRFAEAEALVAEALDRFPSEAPVFVEYARIADMRRDWFEAGARWSTVAERFPDAWEGLTGKARALREQGHLEEAHALLQLAAERFPTATGPIDELARVAEASRDWAAAECRWRESLALRPGPWWSTVGLVKALCEQGRLPEGEAILFEELRLTPHEPWRFVEYARLAERSAAWEEAAERWRMVRKYFPEMWEGSGGLARSLRELGKLDEAEAMLISELDRFPGQTGPLESLALLAQRRRDWAEAERWWRAYIQSSAQVCQAYVWLAITLREQQRISEATDLLLEATGRFAHSEEALAGIVDQLSRPGGTIAVRCLEKFVAIIRSRHANQPAASNAMLFAEALIARERKNGGEYRRLLAGLSEKLPGDQRIRALLREADALGGAADTLTVAEPEV
jgi:tetratricopeptide (TPR) repeat protein